jgi:hypothetical protein
LAYARVWALRVAPNGILFQTTRGRACAAPAVGAAASTARAWRRADAAGSGPAGSSTTNASVPGNVWFCQLVAVPR